MQSSGHDEYSLAKELQGRGVKASSRAIDAWLRGQTSCPLPKLRIVANVLKTDMATLIQTAPGSL
jgi:hypothetical protein